LFYIKQKSGKSVNSVSNVYQVDNSRSAELQFLVLTLSERSNAILILSYHIKAVE